MVLPPPNALPRLPREHVAARLALPVWGGYVLLIVAGTWLLGPERQSVIGHYRTASLAWLEGEPIYAGTEHGFLYLPSFAVLYSPFALLPFKLGGALWRVLNVAVLGVGLWHLVCSGEASRRARVFLVASACVLPLAYASARHGQSTLAMAGAMLGAAGALAQRRHGRAALWCGVGLVSKPLIVVFLLLAIVAHRRLVVPLLGAVAVVVLLPWAAQAPSYVARQYADCLHMFRLAGDPTDAQRFPDLVSGLRSVGVALAPALALGLRVVAAVLTLGLYLRLRRRVPAYVDALWLYTLAAVYLLLFNPRTEHNTYSLIGPAIGLFAALAWVHDGRARWAAAHALLAFLIWQDRDLLRPLVGSSASWTKPFYTLVFLVLAWMQLRSASRGADDEAPAAPRSG